MIRVQLSAGLVALLVISYSAVEREARSLVERGARDLAQTRARQALAIGQAAWSDAVERQRGLTRDAAGRLADGPAAVVTALSRQLGGARAFVLDRDRRLLAESGETASAPPGTLPGLADVRPGTSVLRLAATAKVLVVAAAGAPDGRVVGTVRPIQPAELGAWLAGAGEGALQLGLSGSDQRLRAYSGGEVEATLGAEGTVSLKNADFRVARAELYDDAGGAVELVGFGRIDTEPGLQIAALLRTAWYALGAAGLLIILVVVPVAQRLRSKELAQEGFLGEDDEVPARPARADAFGGDREVPADEEDTDSSWSEVAQVKASEPPRPPASEPPLRPEDLIAANSSRTLPPPQGPSPASEPPALERSMTLPPRGPSAPEASLSAGPAPTSPSSLPARASAALDAGLGAYLPNDPTPPGGFGSARPGSFVGGGLGGFAPAPRPFESGLPSPEPEGPLDPAHDPYAFGQAPEFASEIHPYQDPTRPEVTRGHGSSPPPRPWSGGPSAFGSTRPVSGFAGGPPAAASPITRGPNMRASAPPPGLEDVRPFDLEHYRLVYMEFVDNKRRLGEAVENVTLEGFTAKLRKSEQDLIDRHGCRAVRFQVLVRNRQVSLRPQLVR